jgi:homoserine O-acetyltransferase/O-succinyltransferase
VWEGRCREAPPYPDCQLAYVTFGTLNDAKDNAILFPTWYSGSNKIIEQVFIGKGRALDPDKYFIIVVNQIGGGLSSSPQTEMVVAAGSAAARWDGTFSTRAYRRRRARAAQIGN